MPKLITTKRERSFPNKIPSLFVQGRVTEIQ